MLMKVENPWKQNPWFESVAEAQRRGTVLSYGPVRHSLHEIFTEVTR